MPPTLSQQCAIEHTQPADTAAIRVRDLEHRYDARVALAGISFEVKPSEIFGLLGPNGSGKTTVFRILSTLMLPSDGVAEVMGCDVARVHQGVRRRIGIVFQQQRIKGK